MRPLIPFLFLAACGSVSNPTDEDAAPAPDAPAPPDATAAACDVSGVPVYAPVAVQTLDVLPSATAHAGETIQDELQGTIKRHHIVWPTDTSTLRDQLVIWLPGSGAQPDWFDSIQNIAAAAGYASVSLGYDNETSVNDLCSQTADACNDQVNLSCTEEVRTEMIYGVDASPCLQIAPADSIEHRILRLLQAAAQQSPQIDAAAFLTPSGDDIEWSNIVIAGWSQGGGHAGMIARDHLVARAVFASKGSDSALCPLTVADEDACDTDGDGAFDQDELLVPAPWALEPRATPGEREFGVVHTEESAWGYSREVFEAYGMGAKADTVALDDLGTDYAAFECAHGFSASFTPASGPTDFHISMAIDGSLSRDDAGLPRLAPFYIYALTVPVP